MVVPCRLGDLEKEGDQWPPRKDRSQMIAKKASEKKEKWRCCNTPYRSLRRRPLHLLSLCGVRCPPVLGCFCFFFDPSGFSWVAGVGVWAAGGKIPYLFVPSTSTTARSWSMRSLRGTCQRAHSPFPPPSASGTPPQRLIGATQAFHYRTTGRPSKPPWPPAVVVQVDSHTGHRLKEIIAGASFGRASPEGRSWDEAFLSPCE